MVIETRRGCTKPKPEPIKMQRDKDSVIAFRTAFKSWRIVYAQTGIELQRDSASHLGRRRSDAFPSGSAATASTPRLQVRLVALGHVLMNGVVPVWKLANDGIQLMNIITDSPQAGLSRSGNVTSQLPASPMFSTRARPCPSK
jgi:hypothetical protein